MKQHPHPHVDPRQPREGSVARTNPPVFAWRPPDGSGPFRLEVARDAAFSDLVLRADGLVDPQHLPTEALPTGRLWWRWRGQDVEGEPFAFTIADGAVTLEVPEAAEWLRRLPAGHPRIYFRPEEIEALRESRHGARAEAWAELRATAERLLAEPHTIYQPEYLPDRRLDYDAFFRPWAKIMWDSRRFVDGAQTLALAWLAGGDPRYARAACERMASISEWDPAGASHLAHNDEAHMSVIWHGSHAVDWVWDQFTDDERRKVIDQFRRRGEMTYEHMHDRGSYGISRFDSHAGREIVFLAELAMVFHEEIPDAAKWLDWLRPVLCGIWPIWSGDDGAWAEGPSYGLAYVGIMTMFTTALKRGTGVDLYRRPFWRNHADWRRAILPPYAQWMGFGDHSERWAGTWRSAANLVELIAHETGAEGFGPYVARMRAEAEGMEERAERHNDHVSAPHYLYQPQLGHDAPPRDQLSRIFPAAGQAILHTSPEDADRDIALMFRSSPYGAISHSHANNNDFILHVAGQVMAMPSGYYAGYGSNHHAHWVWHTKSHNCLTLSDGSQILRSPESRGAVENAFEDEHLVYWRGTADDSYREAERCRRHVVYLKAESAFVLIDEFVAGEGVSVAVQWNLHSWAPFGVDEPARRFRLEREGSTLSGHFCYHQNAFFTLTEGFDPPPVANKENRQWHPTHHLRFTPQGFPRKLNLGVVLACGHAELAPAVVETWLGEAGEQARIGEAHLVISARGIAQITIAQRTYTIEDDGISPGD